MYLPSWNMDTLRGKTTKLMCLYLCRGQEGSHLAQVPGSLVTWTEISILSIHLSIYISPAHLIRQGDGAPPEEVLAAPRGAGRLGGAGEGEAALVQVGQLARGPARRAVWVHSGLKK